MALVTPAVSAAGSFLHADRPFTICTYPEEPPALPGPASIRNRHPSTASYFAAQKSEPHFMIEPSNIR
jgi:hypothetical protein